MIESESKRDFSLGINLPGEPGIAQSFPGHLPLGAGGAAAARRAGGGCGGVPPGPEVRCSAGSPAPQSSLPSSLPVRTCSAEHRGGRGETGRGRRGRGSGGQRAVPAPLRPSPKYRRASSLPAPLKLLRGSPGMSVCPPPRNGRDFIFPLRSWQRRAGCGDAQPGDARPGDGSPPAPPTSRTAPAGSKSPFV